VIKKIILLITFSSLCNIISAQQSAITLDFGLPGRFGNRITVYYKAKLISYTYSIPLLYREGGKLFNLMSLHKAEKRLDQCDIKQFKNIVRLTKKEKPSLIKANNATLYIVDFNTNLASLGIKPAAGRDETFLKEFRQMVQPSDSLQEVFRPKDKITVAVHVRKGGGYDRPLFMEKVQIDPFLIPTSDYHDVIFPKRFPPDQFYIDQIKYISKMFHNKPLYIHIFTDSKTPKDIVEKYKTAVGLPNVTFACRETENFYDKNVLEDLLSMANFDCLIRPESYYSMMAEKIGNHMIIISPKSFVWKNRNMSINKVHIIKRIDEKQPK